MRNYRNFRIWAGFMVVLFVGFLSLNAVASAQGKDVPNGKGFQELQAQIDDNKVAIENIELTLGPQGDKGDTGATGATGSQGDKGDKGDTVQGPQGEPGTSGLGDENTVCSAETKGTIRYNTVTNIFEGCDGTSWISLSSTAPSSFVCGTDQVADADGNLYDTVLIGSQCWMAENLNVGTMVNGSTAMTKNTVIEKYCYSNDTNICATDGGLYQWDEMMQYSATEGVQGICPNGWHLPTDTEWKTMEMALGMTQAQADSTGWRGVDQGTQLKDGGSSGFQALLAGIRSTNGSFYYRGTYALIWSSTESGSAAWYRTLDSSEARVYRYTNNKALGFSVRCIKD